MGRKLFALLIVIMAVCLMTVGVYATEESTEVIEETTIVEEVTEEENEIESEVLTEGITEEVKKTIFNLTAEDVAYIKETIQNSTDKAEAIISIASRFDITVEDAEKFIDTVVEFGDKIYGEDEAWVKFREDVFANKRFYSSIIIVSVCGLVLLLVLIFVLRSGSLLKIIKADRDSDMTSTDEFRAEFKTYVDGMFKDNLDAFRTAFDEQMEGIKDVLSEGKTIEEKEDALHDSLDMLLKEFDDAHITQIRESLDKSESDASAALKIVHQTALHNLQILYLIMGKTKLPIANEESRKLWYEEAVNNVNRMMPQEESEKDAGEA